MIRKTIFAAVAVVLFAVLGCAGPTRTAGTEGLAAEKLATLHVPRHTDVRGWRYSPARMVSVSIDGVSYKMKADQDFYLTAGTHHLEMAYADGTTDPAWPASSLQLDLLFSTRGTCDAKFQSARQYLLAGRTVGSGSMYQHEHSVIEQRAAPPIRSQSSMAQAAGGSAPR
jgi:hypothetical protein